MAESETPQLDYAQPDKEAFWPSVTRGIWWMRLFILLVLAVFALVGILVAVSGLYIIIRRALPPTFVFPLFAATAAALLVNRL